jgi:hypothetical protein
MTVSGGSLSEGSILTSFILLSRTGLLPAAIASSCLALSKIFPSPITSATSSFIFALIRFIAANPGQTTSLGQRPLLHYCRTNAMVPALANNELDATDPLVAGLCTNLKVRPCLIDG